MYTRQEIFLSTSNKCTEEVNKTKNVGVRKKGNDEFEIFCV